MKHRGIIFATVAVSLAFADVGKVPLGTEVPASLKEVGIDQKLGTQVPLDAEFDNEAGQKIRLGQLLGKRSLMPIEAAKLATGGHH